MRTRILYEDRELFVVFKPAGLAVQSGRVGETDMASELQNHLAASSPSRDGRAPYLGLVHRLDQPVSGILVVAKTPRAAGVLSTQKMEKEYRALCFCDPARPQPLPCAAVREAGEGMRMSVATDTEAAKNSESPLVLTDYLLRDPKTNSSRVVSPGTPGAKRAILKLWVPKEPPRSQEPPESLRIPKPQEPSASKEPPKLQGTSTKDPCHTLEVPGRAANETFRKDGRDGRQDEARGESGGSVLLAVSLETGRHHQIRVQLAAAGLPILGDRKYGTPESMRYAGREGIRSLCLCAYRLSFRHPGTGKQMEYRMEALPWEG